MKHSKNVKNFVLFLSFKKINLFGCHKSVLLIFIPIILIFLLTFSITFVTGCDAISNLKLGNLSDINTQQEKSQDNKNSTDNKQQDESETMLTQDSDVNTDESTSSTDNNDLDNINTSQSENEDENSTQQSEKAKEITIEPSLQTINVYYANNTGEYLVGEARDIEGDSKLVDAIYEMMKEPVDPSLVSDLPATTKINSVKAYDNGIAKVDLSQSFLDDRFVSDTVDILLIYSIVNTLTEFKEIQAVEFYIDGKKLDILGQLDIKGPIYRRSDLIKQQ